MKLSDIENIIIGDERLVTSTLNVFLEEYNQTLTFPEFNYEFRQKLWGALFGYLELRRDPEFCTLCLSAIKTLSRDKTYLDELIQEKWINILLIHSDLTSSEVNMGHNDHIGYVTNIEALKCLCNLVFNSSVVQHIFAETKAVEFISRRHSISRNPELPSDLKYFDMKLLFLITALHIDMRIKLREKLNGIIYLTESLELILNETSKVKNDTPNECSLSDAQINLACEILKVLFNLTIESDLNITIDEKEENYYNRLAGVLHNMLLSSVQTPTKKIELQSHIINLLTALPSSCLKELITTYRNDHEVTKDMEYEGYNMEAVYILMTFLKNKFDNEMTILGQQELLSPILSVLLKMSKSSRIMRKYLRMQILPPLRDVHNRPEQGSTLRNHFCRLLTTPTTQVRELTAELLFILCKENVARMVKYTGYGNAAGLFANRGLMGIHSNEDAAGYSSESEDSDTEEYNEYKHGINPVVGCYEPPHPNPTEGMSEEQKEYEAMKLVELVDSLTIKGIVQPCRIGIDGRPEPIQHVLQLQELPRQINKNSDSS